MEIQAPWAVRACEPLSDERRAQSRNPCCALASGSPKAAQTAGLLLGRRHQNTCPEVRARRSSSTAGHGHPSSERLQQPDPQPREGGTQGSTTPRSAGQQAHGAELRDASRPAGPRDLRIPSPAPCSSGEAEACPSQRSCQVCSSGTALSQEQGCKALGKGWPHPPGEWADGQAEACTQAA